jgi:hypothetical protein
MLKVGKAIAAKMPHKSSSSSKIKLEDNNLSISSSSSSSSSHFYEDVYEDVYEDGSFDSSARDSRYVVRNDANVDGDGGTLEAVAAAYDDISEDGRYYYSRTPAISRRVHVLFCILTLNDKQ